ncbi:hypothetical protein KKD49_16555 [Myxococcota bacterium]|nr:hypothetical protein [Myxococcota bacterium]
MEPHLFRSGNDHDGQPSFSLISCFKGAASFQKRKYVPKFNYTDTTVASKERGKSNVLQSHKPG